MLLSWLSVALAAPDPVPTAIAAVDTLPPGDLAAVAVVPHGGPAGVDRLGPQGGVVQLRSELDGVPVDLTLNVRLGPGGEVRQVVADPVPTTRIDGVPLPMDRALAAVPFPGPGRARLSWQARDGVLRQVWTVELERPAAGLQVPRIQLDAVSGALLDLDDAAIPRAPVALAYVHNPLVDDRAQRVLLPTALKALSDARLEMRQCRDLGDLVIWDLPSGELPVHSCTRVPAAGPVDGDYLFDPVPWPEDPARDEDDFAAAHVFWNVHQGLDWFEALGWVPAEDFDPRLIVTVNQRDQNLWSEETASDPTAPLVPYENAYSTGGFHDGDDLWVPPSLVFGQGGEIDYAYDADVIHHELGHFVVKSQFGPSWSYNGSWGPSVRASTLNEGLADYFSSAIHRDPWLAEYAAGGRGEAIRDLSGTASCGADLWGEAHYDSLPFSQPLWQLRKTLPQADRALLDQIVLDSLSVMGLHPDFDVATTTILALVQERLGQPVADDLETRWRDRNALTCPPVRDVTPGPDPFLRATLVRGSFAGSTFGAIPGYLQLRVEIPPGGGRVTLRFEQNEYLGLDPYGSNVPHELGVVGRSGTRLTWTRETRTTRIPLEDGGYAVDTVEQWISDGEALGASVETGTRPDDGGRYLWHEASLTWDVPLAGPYVFQLTNAWPRAATAYDLGLTVEPLERFAEPWPDPPAVSDPIVANPGCGCAAGPRGLGWLGLLSAIGLVRRTPDAGAERRSRNRRQPGSWRGSRGGALGRGGRVARRSERSRLPPR